MSRRIINSRVDSNSSDTCTPTSVVSCDRKEITPEPKNVSVKRQYTEETRFAPNEYLWKRLEGLIEAMEAEENGIPVRNVKSIMSVIPSVFTGSDIVQWLMRTTGAQDINEAVHLGSCIAAAGYLFCIDDHSLTVKNDSHSYYRFQTPFLYPSRTILEPDTMDYAVYLCKRTMQSKHRLELTDYEAERLASLQNLYCHRWEFVYLQAESEAKVDKKRDKIEKLVLESQERAYWDVHRPAPGCVNTTEVDMRKLCRAKRPRKAPYRPPNFPIPSGPAGQLHFHVLDGLSSQEQMKKLSSSNRMRVKMSKAIENLMNFTDQYSEFDLLLCSSSSAAVSALPQLGSSVVGAATAGAGLAGGSVAMGTGGGGGYPWSSSLHHASERYTNATSAGHGSVQLPLTRTGSAGAMNIHGVLHSASGGTGGGMETGGAGLTASDSILAGDHGAGGGGGGQGLASSASNPWISDNAEYWNTNVPLKELPIRRVKRWSFSIHELLRDPAGREEFQKWLEKEFSVENLRFWQTCQELKGAPLRDLARRIELIYAEYLAPSATEPLNVDSRVGDLVAKRVAASLNSTPDRYCFEEAEEHIFNLMKSDSYCRFLRSDVYRELFSGTKKKSKKHRSGVSLSGQIMSVSQLNTNID